MIRIEVINYIPADSNATVFSAFHTKIYRMMLCLCCMIT